MYGLGASGDDPIVDVLASLANDLDAMSEARGSTHDPLTSMLYSFSRRAEAALQLYYRSREVFPAPGAAR